MNYKTITETRKKTKTGKLHFLLLGRMPAECLNPNEHAALGNLSMVVDCQRVRLYRSSSRGPASLLRRVVLFASRNRATALGNHVFLPDRWEHDTAVLAHELTHCGQYQAWGPVRYFAKGLSAQVQDLLFRKMRIGSSPYHYQIDAGKPFDAYGMEQQGQIVEDCFRGHPDARRLSPFQPGR
jgi:hypothetical protein